MVARAECDVLPIAGELLISVVAQGPGDATTVLIRDGRVLESRECTEIEPVVPGEPAVNRVEVLLPGRLQCRGWFQIRSTLGAPQTQTHE